jgi:hypothetical protein
MLRVKLSNNEHEDLSFSRPFSCTVFFALLILFVILISFFIFTSISGFRRQNPFQQPQVMKKPFKVSQESVELLDLFPTLVDLTGLPSLPYCGHHGSASGACTQGQSLVASKHNNDHSNFAFRCLFQFLL